MTRDDWKQLMRLAIAGGQAIRREKGEEIDAVRILVAMARAVSDEYRDVIINTGREICAESFTEREPGSKTAASAPESPQSFASVS